MGCAAIQPMDAPISGVSEEARIINADYKSLTYYKEGSVALFGHKAKVLSELFEEVEHCREDKWDGYGAEPVSELSLRLAEKIIRCLPEDLPSPEITIDPRGYISMDWIPSKSKMFSLIASKTGRVPYSWLDGTERGYAVTNMKEGQLSDRLVDEMRRILV